MRYRICLLAGIMGIAVIAGIIESLAAPRQKPEEGVPGVADGAETAPAA